MDAQSHTPSVGFRPRRPRPKVVTLTDRAAERVREILAKADRPYAGLRVGVKNGGCAGQEYVLSYAECGEPLDEVVEGWTARIVQHETDHLRGTLYVDTADLRTLTAVG